MEGERPRGWILRAAREGGDPPRFACGQRVRTSPLVSTVTRIDCGVRLGGEIGVVTLVAACPHGDSYRVRYEGGGGCGWFAGDELAAEATDRVLAPWETG